MHLFRKDDLFRQPPRQAEQKYDRSFYNKIIKEIEVCISTKLTIVTFSIHASSNVSFEGTLIIR